MSTMTHVGLRVADEVWIAVALLHREHPEKSDFTIQEITGRARAEGLVEPLRPGVNVHATIHCVANRPPSPATYRMLCETRRGARRLYRQGDDCHPERKGKITPDRDAIPEPYRYLIDWYLHEYALARDSWLLSVTELSGAGKGVYADPDKYVRELREGWA